MIDINLIIKNGIYNYNWANVLLESLNFLINKNYLNREIISENGGNILEIGSFEGLSSNIIYELLVKSTNNILTCVDPFPTIKPFKSYCLINNNKNNIINTYDNFKKNTSHMNNNLIFIKDYSYNCDFDENKYFFIYIDGCHDLNSVYNDAKIAYKSLKNNGIILFDDYMIKNQDTRSGIDKFIKENNDKIEIIFKSYQLAIKIKKN
jgi:hypothetical protein